MPWPMLQLALAAFEAPVRVWVTPKQRRSEALLLANRIHLAESAVRSVQQDCNEGTTQWGREHHYLRGGTAHCQARCCGATLRMGALACYEGQTLHKARPAKLSNPAAPEWDAMSPWKSNSRVSQGSLPLGDASEPRPAILVVPNQVIPEPALLHILAHERMAGGVFKHAGHVPGPQPIHRDARPTHLHATTESSAAAHAKTPPCLGGHLRSLLLRCMALVYVGKPWPLPHVSLHA